MLMIRDEILKSNPILSSISNFYYHNTVSAMLPLRPPLGAKYHDRTVLYFGNREEIRTFFSYERTIPFIRPEDVDWDLVHRGVPLILDTSKGGPPIAIQSEARTGPQGFELLLVDADKAGAGFWERLSTENPWLLERTAILHHDKIEMAPSMRPTLDMVMALQQVESPGIYELIGRAILAVQFKFDHNASRRWIKESGFTLLINVGLPMLMLWSVNGLLALITLWPRGGMARITSVLVVVGLLIYMAPSYIGFYSRGPLSVELSRWNGLRSEIAGVHFRLSQLFDQRGEGLQPAMLSALQAEIASCHERVVVRHWNEAFFVELNRAVSEANPKVRARAMATLQRLLGSIHLLDLRVLMAYKMERLRDDRTLEAWTKFQHERLPGLVKDPDPIVSYWALLCAEFADKENGDVTQSILDALDSSDLNVRDKAVDAIRHRMTPEAMNKLAGMVSERPGGKPPEPCDYVRLDAYSAILFNHEKFPPSKPMLVPASGQ
ncbi:MAG: HEAT repeat domain-containing protein [Planctomycetota bacterium]